MPIPDKRLLIELVESIIEETKSFKRSDTDKQQHYSTLRYEADSLAVTQAFSLSSLIVSATLFLAGFGDSRDLSNYFILRYMKEFNRDDISRLDISRQGQGKSREIVHIGSTDPLTFVKDYEVRCERKKPEHDLQWPLSEYIDLHKSSNLLLDMELACSQGSASVLKLLHHFDTGHKEYNISYIHPHYQWLEKNVTFGFLSPSDEATEALRLAEAHSQQMRARFPQMEAEAAVEQNMENVPRMRR